MYQLHISKGNIKMGDIPSVSLMPCQTCDPKAPCFKKCYARRMLRFANVRKAWAENTAFALNDPDRFFANLKLAIMFTSVFRFHVGGDMPNADYFARVVKLAEQSKHCQILIFTKRYGFVNEYIDDGGKIPKNLHVIFSGWYDWKTENPHGLPETDIIKSAEEIQPKMKVCGGNCANCVCRNTGCWSLKKGEKLYFIEH